MLTNWLRSRRYKVRCPDGSLQFVFRDLDHVFPMHFSEGVASTAAAVSGLKSVAATVDARRQSKISNLLIQIDEVSGSMQAHFRAAYVLYAAAPCKKLEYLQQAIESIKKDEANLRLVSLTIREISVLLAAPRRKKASYSTPTVDKYLDSALAVLRSNDIASMMAEKMREVADNARDWQQL